jgi:hypothetical protein
MRYCSALVNRQKHKLPHLKSGGCPNLSCQRLRMRILGGDELPSAAFVDEHAFSFASPRLPPRHGRSPYPTWVHPCSCSQGRGLVRTLSLSHGDKASLGLDNRRRLLDEAKPTLDGLRRPSLRHKHASCPQYSMTVYLKGGAIFDGRGSSSWPYPWFSSRQPHGGYFLGFTHR